MNLVINKKILRIWMLSPAMAHTPDLHTIKKL